MFGGPRTKQPAPCVLRPVSPIPEEEGGLPVPYLHAGADEDARMPDAPRRFDFADAWWFRIPLRVVVVSVFVFTLMSMEPALTDRSSPDHVRALVGITVLAVFVVLAVAYMVSLSDSYVEIDRGLVFVRFESFLHFAFRLEDIESVEVINPRPAWRYRWGLATNFRDRISCSHGGQLIEIRLRNPCRIRLWPRTLLVRRIWLAPRRWQELIAAMSALDATPGSSERLAA